MVAVGYNGYFSILLLPNVKIGIKIDLFQTKIETGGFLKRKVDTNFEESDTIEIVKSFPDSLGSVNQKATVLLILRQRIRTFEKIACAIKVFVWVLDLKGSEML